MKCLLFYRLDLFHFFPLNVNVCKRKSTWDGVKNLLQLRFSFEEYFQKAILNQLFISIICLKKVKCISFIYISICEIKNDALNKHCKKWKSMRRENVLFLFVLLLNNVCIV